MVIKQNKNKKIINIKQNKLKIMKFLLKKKKKLTLAKTLTNK